MFFFREKKILITDFFPSDYVDIHSHLLPGIDDGAKNLSESIALIEQMSSYGIHHFVTTPHVLGTIYPNTTDTILSKLEKVKNALSKKGLSNISLDAAAEYMLDEHFLERLSNNDILPLKHPYVLIEMSYYNAPNTLYEILFEIQLKGFKPVLAHPERYHFYHQDYNSYYKLKNAGCLFQLNLLSLTDYYDKGVQRTAKRLLKDKLYDLSGTDAHHMKHLEFLKKISTKNNSLLLKPLFENNTALFGS